MIFIPSVTNPQNTARIKRTKTKTIAKHKMRITIVNIITLIFLLLLLLKSNEALVPKPPPPPISNGYNCFSDRSIYPCKTFAFYRAGADPSLLDLPTVADLFGLSRASVAAASNLSTNTTALSPSQPLLIPLTCSSCASASSNISFSPVTYQIAAGDNYYHLSSFKFGNLTSYPAVEAVNPSLVATNLPVGVSVLFPIFCQCPARRNASTNNNSNNESSLIITYTFQPNDTYASIATEFGTHAASIAALNGPESTATPYLTILVPVPMVPPPVIQKYPKRAAPVPPPPTAPVIVRKDRKGAVVGLGVGMAVMGAVALVLLLCLLRALRRGEMRKRIREDEEKMRKFGGGEGAQGKKERKFGRSLSNERLMTDISEWLDKYKVFGMEELVEATDGFDRSTVIQGSVYKGVIDGEIYAIKKMKWNACDELKILQKVNHTNLVKLEGFCIEPEADTCYLVYEYIENGSLYSWLHEPARACSLDWRARLRIALDLAHGLQYIHEHTWPRVVHKDIKSSNVLLDARMRAKIANFGLAKSGCNAVTTHIVGTQGYIAPEYLVDGLVTTKMDVFAYGVVLLELVSGKEAASEGGEVLWMEVERMFEKKDGRIEGRIREWMDGAIFETSINMESVMNVVNIARACLQKDPAKRPSMVDVAYTLSKSDEMFSDFSEEGIVVGSGDSVIAR